MGFPVAVFTAQQVQQLILLEVGAGLDPGQTDQVAQNVQLVWDRYAAKAYWPGLQALYCKRGCIDILLGQLRRQIAAVVGPLNRPMQQIWDHLLAMRKEVVNDIQLAERNARKNTYVDDDLTQTAPLMPADLDALENSWGDRPDEGDPRYLGIR